MLAWLTNYIQDRYQRVLINRQFWESDNGWNPPRFSPWLSTFSYFLNEITHVVKHCQIRMFADDTSLFIDMDDRVRVAERLEQILAAISAWTKHG